jgi:exopolysaccharide biosynthesis protein
VRALLFLCLSSATALAAPVRTSAVETHPGIDHETWEDAAIPARIHLVRVDLTSAEIALYATKEAERGSTTGEFALALEAQVAINGDSFSPAGYRPRGLAIGDGTSWTNTADDASSAVFHLRRVGERTVAAISPPEQVVAMEQLPEGTQAAISGRPLLVRAGAVETSFDCNDPVTVACTRAPRSAGALTADGNTLLLAVVDGWQAGSSGMTAAELAAFLRARGAHNAVAFDGGSSATMILDGALANKPSDGVQRSVANHLAIKHGALPTGQLVGIICSTDIFTCANDDSFRLPGAEVTLDDGRVKVVGADAFYNFTGVTPRLACVTVRKTGYKTKTKCETVLSGVPNYNSVELEEGVDPPMSDAGVPDDASTLTDSGVTGDGTSGSDAGTTDPDPPGGCCGVGSKPEGTLILVALVAFMARRRRGTTPAR